MTYNDICAYIEKNNGIIKEKVFSFNYDNGNINLQISKEQDTLYIYTVIGKINDSENEDFLLWIAKKNFQGTEIGMGYLGILFSENVLIYSSRISMTNLNQDTLDIEILKFNEWKKIIKDQFIQDFKTLNNNSENTDPIIKEDKIQDDLYLFSNALSI